MGRAGRGCGPLWSRTLGDRPHRAVPHLVSLHLGGTLQHNTAHLTG